MKKVEWILLLTLTFFIISIIPIWIFSVVTDINKWSFLGSYLGGFIGIIGVYFVALIEGKNNIKRESIRFLRGNLQEIKIILLRDQSNIELEKNLKQEIEDVKENIRIKKLDLIYNNVCYENQVLEYLENYKYSRKERVNIFFKYLRKEYSEYPFNIPDYQSVESFYLLSKDTFFNEIISKDTVLKAFHDKVGSTVDVMLQMDLYDKFKDINQESHYALFSEIGEVNKFSLDHFTEEEKRIMLEFEKKEITNEDNVYLGQRTRLIRKSEEIINSLKENSINETIDDLLSPTSKEVVNLIK